MSIALSGRGLKCIDLHRIAHGEATSLCEDAAADMTENVASMPDGPSILEQKRHWLVGGFADTLSADELCRVFILGHCAGVGDPLAKPLVRATMAARANVLATATTGCRPDAARVLIDMLNQDVVPLFPAKEVWGPRVISRRWPTLHGSPVDTLSVPLQFWTIDPTPRRRSRSSTG